MDTDLKFKSTYPTVFFLTQVYNINTKPTNICLQTHTIYVQVANITVQTNTFCLQTAKITLQTLNSWTHLNTLSTQPTKANDTTTLTSQRCKSGTWSGTQTHRTEANLPKSLPCPTHRTQSSSATTARHPPRRRVCVQQGVCQNTGGRKLSSAFCNSIVLHIGQDIY